ncbi:MAG: sugar ABC transporter permease [Kiloniellales bacterium]|nr:sugar ABC transporter permease [Kiloniellales bacterium]
MTALGADSSDTPASRALRPAGRPHARTFSLFAYAFVAPAGLLLLALILLPLISVLILSATDYILAEIRLSFVGLKNYQKLLADAGARRALGNTLVYVGIVMPVSVALGLLLALLLHRRGRSRRFYEVVFFLPVTSTMVAMAVVWQYLLHGRIGPINAVLAGIGFPRLDFLTDPEIALYALAAIGVWQLTGFTMVLFLAGLTAIPNEVYEAAALDGADRGFERFWRISWPLLAPTTLFVVVITSITAFQVFDTVAVLTQGGLI